MTTTTFKAYGAGEAAAKFKPGDFILTHHQTIPARLIRIGQWLRYHGELRKYSHWNHVAIIVDEDGALIEAVGRGVVYGHIEEYKDVEYYLVNTRLNKQSRDQTVAAAKSFLNDKYGWATIASLTLQLLTGIKIQFSTSNSKICSTLLAMSLWAGGIIFDRDPDELMPADIAAAFKVEIPVQVDPASA